ncbi:hypothetical protein B0H19DRAFT_1333426 [Mycena capillaripes]|nr:hypothetical protein B0H19DRAFT_1333426 [Mycena capillaripes]
MLPPFRAATRRRAPRCAIRTYAQLSPPLRWLGRTQLAAFDRAVGGAASGPPCLGTAPTPLRCGNTRIQQACTRTWLTRARGLERIGAPTCRTLCHLTAVTQNVIVDRLQHGSTQHVVSISRATAPTSPAICVVTSLCDTLQLPTGGVRNRSAQQTPPARTGLHWAKDTQSDKCRSNEKGAKGQVGDRTGALSYHDAILIHYRSERCLSNWRRRKHQKMWTWCRNPGSNKPQRRWRVFGKPQQAGLTPTAWTAWRRKVRRGED